jgi:uncharacterized protein DUF1579
MKHAKMAMLIVAMCTFCMAQTKNDSKKSAMSHPHEKAAAGNTMVPANAPPEMLPVLSTVGNWSATIKNEPTPWNPKGSTDRGTMVMSKGPGGSSVIQDFRSNGPMGPYQGHAIIYWDTIAKKQSSVWCDNVSGCVFGVTKMDGDKKWSTEMEQEFQGKKMKMVSHGAIVDSNTMHEEFTQSVDGGPMQKIMTIDYKRAAKK